MPHQSHAYLRYPRLLVGAFAIALVVLSIQVATPRLSPRADASSGTLLCVGFGGCGAAGMPNSGYEQHWGTMYWRMYSGRNCVNYAAFRMVTAGMPNVRPWSGSGNATNWGYAMSSITDTTPRKGAVAWWKANAPGAGSLGHVAYVEKVISPTDIIISESNWGSDFDWREVTTSNAWPTGFIHFVDKTIRNVSPPKVTGGTPTVGKALKVSGGSWSPSAKLAYTWYIGGKPQSGSSSWYTPTPVALNHNVWVKVTATAAGYTTASTLLKLGLAAPGTLSPAGTPVISGAIAGRPVAGRPLTVGGDAFSPDVSGHTIHWYADGKAISNATDRTFTPGEAQVGKAISATVTGTRSGFTSLTLTAARTANVVEPQVGMIKAGSITGSPTRGGTLRANPGTFGPKGQVTFTYQWLREGKPIAGATKATYSPTSDDVGHALSVTVDASAPQRRDLARTYAVGRPVTTKARLEITHFSKPGSTRFRVSVKSPGVNAWNVGGWLTLKFGTQVQHVAVTHGTAVITFTYVVGGNRTLTTRYSGSGLVLGVIDTRHFRVASAKKTSTTTKSTTSTKTATRTPSASPSVSPSASASAKASSTASASSSASATSTKR